MDLKSWYANHLNNSLSLPEEDEELTALPQESETARAIVHDVRLLQGLERSWQTLTTRLEEIVQEQNATELLNVADAYEEECALLKKYRVLPSLAQRSLLRGLAYAQCLETALENAARSLAHGLGERFAAKSEALETTDDLCALTAIRAEMDTFTTAYARLCSRFPLIAQRKQLDAYVHKMPRIAAIARELDAIEAMLKQDQSKDSFAELRCQARLVRGGFFAGKLRKACKGLGYREGLLRCDAYAREIPAYIRHFPQIVQDHQRLHECNVWLKRCWDVLVQELQATTGSAVEKLTIAKKALSRESGVTGNFTYYRDELRHYQELRKGVANLAEQLSNKLVMQARAEWAGFHEPPQPQTLAQLQQNARAVQQQIGRMHEFAKLFHALDEKKYLAYRRDMIAKLENWLGLQNSCDQQVRACVAAEKQIYDIRQRTMRAEALFTNPASLDRDLAEAKTLLAQSLASLPEEHVLQAQRQAYHALVQHYQKTCAERISHGFSMVVESYKTPVPQTGAWRIDRAAVEARLTKVRHELLPMLQADFASFPTQTHEEQLKQVVYTLEARLSALESSGQVCQELEHKIAMMKSALLNMDRKKFEHYAAFEIVDQVSDPYTVKTAQVYNDLVWHVRFLLMARDPPREPAVRYFTSPNAEPFNFFAYVRDSETPRHPGLQRLRDQLVSGTVQERLQVLEGALRTIANVPLCGKDKQWLVSLKAAYERDTAEGYLAHAEQLGVPQYRLQRIKRLLEQAAD